MRRLDEHAVQADVLAKCKGLRLLALDLRRQPGAGEVSVPVVLMMDQLKNLAAVFRADFGELKRHPFARHLITYFGFSFHHGKVLGGPESDLQLGSQGKGVLEVEEKPATAHIRGAIANDLVAQNALDREIGANPWIFTVVLFFHWGVSTDSHGSLNHIIILVCLRRNTDRILFDLSFA